MAAPHLHKLAVLAVVSLLTWSGAACPQAKANNQTANEVQSGDAAKNSARSEEVRQLFAEGLRLLKINRAYEARQLLERAASIDPGNPAVHCNLGLAYQNSGNLNRAITEFSTALRLRPSMPEATLNMAGCLQSMGRTQDAVAWYDRYVRENPNIAGLNQIQDVIAALRSAAGRPGSDPRLPDYFECITYDGTYRWPAQSLPIRVFIDGGQGIDGFRESYRRILVEAFDAWVKASGNRLSYLLVSDRGQADVVCDWTSNPAEVSEAGTQSERGMAHIFAKGGAIRRATLKILTTPILPDSTLSDDDMKKASLHEVGHVLGLQGHSTNNHDVMFLTVDTSTVWPVLSKRDRATITHLYQGYPESTAAAPPVMPLH